MSRTTVYEFYGCYWYSCPKCMRNKHQLTADNDTKESQGYPARAQTDEEKCEYEMEVYNQEIISLDTSKVLKNPGNRGLAKLMLNSFWGKFG
uniref:DNA-directed DNA polymerase n=1 Tax=Romanomermis culicivorax TaxID=13658 RepID=A0A915HK89_ROMCU